MDPTEAQYLPLSEMMDQLTLVTEEPEGSVYSGTYAGRYYLIFQCHRGSRQTDYPGVPRQDEEQVTIWSFDSQAAREQYQKRRAGEHQRGQ